MKLKRQESTKLSTNKLLLVDGSALLHRAYHAYPPLTTKTGEVVGAVYGVISILFSVLESEKPSHVLVAWDLPKPTFRHEKYVGYKAQRPKTDEALTTQIPRVKEVIRDMGLMQLAEAGYEADDIIGTMATLNNQNEVVILTGDQDTMQLVSKNVRVLTPAKGANPPVLYGPDEVFNKYGVHPEQIVDYKALVGDPSDNIPGVAGIGPKGASNLIKMFGTLERIYRDIKEVQLHFGELTAKKLADGRESATLSRELSEIVTDMPIVVKEEEMEYRTGWSEEFRAKLEELGFKSLLRRVYGEALKKSKVNTNQIGLF